MDMRDGPPIGRWFGRDDSAGGYEVVVYGPHASWDYAEYMLRHGDSLVLFEEVEQMRSENQLGTRIDFMRHMEAVFDEGVRMVRVIGNAESAAAEPWLFHGHGTFAIFRDGACCSRYRDNSEEAHLAHIRRARAWRCSPRPWVVSRPYWRETLEEQLQAGDSLVVFHHAVPRHTTVAALSALHQVAPTVAADGVKVAATICELGRGDARLPYAAFYRDGRRILARDGPDLDDAQLVALAADGRRLADRPPLQIVGENVFRDYQEQPALVDESDESLLDALNLGAEASLAAYLERREWVMVTD